MKSHVIISFLVICLSCYFCSVYGVCQQTCIPISYTREYTCSDIHENRPFEVKQPGPCSKKNTEGRNAYCCTGQDAWVKYNTKPSQQNDISSISRRAIENEFPHQVYIKRNKGKQPLHCSGTVYNRNFVITSAHCVFNNATQTFDKPEHLTVVAGLTHVDSADIPSENSYAVTEIFYPKRYRLFKVSEGNYYDIAVIKLEKRLDYDSGKIRPLRIAPKDFTPDFTASGIALDWGKTEKSKTLYPLLKSGVPLRSPDACQKLFGEDGRYHNGLQQQICAAGGSSGMNAFEGDNGGTLICPDVKNRNTPVLCGVASYRPCESCKSPFVYTRISSYFDWIKQVTKNEVQESQFFMDETIGGETVEPEDFLVRIFGRERTCDGTMISPNMVVTARSCVGENSKNFSALVIVHARTKTRLQQDRLVDDEKFEEIGNENATKILRSNIRRKDSAFIMLREPFKIHFYPQTPPEEYVITDAVEMSYSLTTNNVELRKFKEMDKYECQKSYYDLLNVKLKERMTCATETYSGGSTCNRGLGSPLICEGRYLCGIATSRGCSLAFPNIFTEVGEVDSEESRKKAKDSSYE